MFDAQRDLVQQVSPCEAARPQKSRRNRVAALTWSPVPGRMLNRDTLQGLGFLTFLYPEMGSMFPFPGFRPGTKTEVQPPLWDVLDRFSLNKFDTVIDFG